MADQTFPFTVAAIGVPAPTVTSTTALESLTVPVRVGVVTHGVASAPNYLVITNTVSKFAPQIARNDTMRLAYVRVWQRASQVSNQQAS